MIEAMACGTPVLAYSGGAVPEIVEHGLTGFIVANEQEAAGAVPRLATLSRARIRARFEERFTARRMAKDYLRGLSRDGREPRAAASGGQGVSRGSPR